MTWATNVGGVWQIAKTPAVNVAGVNRPIKQGWVNVANVWRLFFSAADILQMLVGTAGNANGYAQGGFGTLTPSTLGDGTVVTEVAVSNLSAPVPRTLIVALSGYPGAITAGYLTSVQFDAGAPIVPSGANFTFGGGSAGGTAQFTWTGQIIFAPNATVTVAVTRT